MEHRCLLRHYRRVARVVIMLGIESLITIIRINVVINVSFRIITLYVI